MSFNSYYSFNDRLADSKKIMNKYSDRIPVICERFISLGNECPLIDKNKFLLPCDYTIGQFHYIIRKRMKISSEKAMFLFINNSIYHSSELISNIYENNKDTDGFLYIKYTSENTFG